MIILYGFGEGFGLPEISPYVTKTEVQLKMAGLAYEKRVGDREVSPKGQLPYADIDGMRVADSTFIRACLERAYGLDFDEGLTPEQRAHAWAMERMVENHFGWTLVNERWLDPVNFARGPAAFFDGAPEAVRQAVLSQVRQNVHAVGVGRHTDREVVALAARSLAAVSAVLADKPFLFGERPCGADATVFSLLAGALTPHFDGPVRRRAEGYGNLVAYVDRLMARFYPDFAWNPDPAMRKHEAA